MKSERKNGKIAWIAWITAVVFYLYEYFVRVVPAVMEHELAIKFSASAAVMAAALGSYYLVYAPLQLFAGMMFDRFGGKSVLVPASVLVAVGCLLPIIPSESLVFITLGRICAGIGSSFAFIGVMYLAAVWFHDNHLAFLSGLATSLGICGALIGQAPLSLLVDSIGCNRTWMLTSIVGLLVSVAIALFIPKTPIWEREKRLTLSRKSSFRKFVSGLISVCKNKQTWIIGLVASALYMPTVVFGDLWGVQYVECALGVPKSKAAEIAGMLYFGWLVGSPLAGLLSDFIQCRRRLLIIGSLLSTILFSILLLAPISTPFMMGLVLFLAGMTSSPQVICFVTSLEVNKSNAKGSAIAVINMLVMLVGGLFQPIVGKLIEINNVGIEGHMFSHAAFRNALLTMPILTLMGFVFALYIKKGININD